MHRFPEELRDLPNWIVYKLKPKEKDPTKFDKIPYHVSLKYKASSTNPLTWSSFDDVMEQCETMQSQYGHGPGFMFCEPYFGVDIDHCVVDGVISDLGVRIIKEFGTYAEFSPSRTGVHLIGNRGDLPNFNRKRQDLGLECYTSERFFTVTGNQIEGTSPFVELRKNEFANFILQYWPPEEKININLPSNNDLTASDVIARASNDEKFWLLHMEGDLTSYNNDHSAADGALCMKLAFYSERNPRVMDEIFRKSRLMRPKWDERRGDQTYGEYQINNAIAKTSEVFQSREVRENEKKNNDTDIIQAIKDDIDQLKSESDEWEILTKLKALSERIAVLSEQDASAVISYAKTSLKLSREKIKILKTKPKRASEKTQSFHLDTYDDGGIIPSDKNLLKIFDEDDQIKMCFRKNLFSNDIDVVRAGAWCEQNKKIPRQLSNMDTYQVKRYLIEKYNVEYKKFNIDECLISAAIRNAYDPLLDYLNALRWDGVNRLDTWLCDYMGVEDNPYTRHVGKMTLVAAIKRAYEPGCKYDHVLVLAGEQGQRKSSVIEILGGEWYQSISLDSKDRDTIQKMLGTWFIELGEGTPLRKKEINEFKNFISTRANKERFAFERHMETHMRRSVFVMTINPEDIGYLNDSENRRFLPVRVYCAADTKSLVEHRDQLFAQAVQEYKNGFRIYLDPNLDAEILDKLKFEHDIAEVKDDFEAPIKKWMLTGLVKIKDRRSGHLAIESRPIPKIGTCLNVWQMVFDGDAINYSFNTVGRSIARVLRKLKMMTDIKDLRAGDGFKLLELSQKLKDRENKKASDEAEKILESSEHQTTQVIDDEQSDTWED